MITIAFFLVTLSMTTDARAAAVADVPYNRARLIRAFHEAAEPTAEELAGTWQIAGEAELKSNGMILINYYPNRVYDMAWRFKPGERGGICAREVVGGNESGDCLPVEIVGDSARFVYAREYAWKDSVKRVVRCRILRQDLVIPRCSCDPTENLICTSEWTHTAPPGTTLSHAVYTRKQ